jgi:hypothetical protein
MTGKQHDKCEHLNPGGSVKDRLADVRAAFRRPTLLDAPKFAAASN